MTESAFWITYYINWLLLCGSLFFRAGSFWCDLFMILTSYTPGLQLVIFYQLAVYSASSKIFQCFTTQLCLFRTITSFKMTYCIWSFLETPLWYILKMTSRVVRFQVLLCISVQVFGLKISHTCWFSYSASTDWVFAAWNAVFKVLLSERRDTGRREDIQN